MKIISVRDHVIFQFVDDTTSSRFVNTAASGIAIALSDGNQSGQARWGIAKHVGPECVDVKDGDIILVEAGMWTQGFQVDDQRYWKTDESKVALISDEAYPVY